MVNELGELDGFDVKWWLCIWLYEEVLLFGWKKLVMYFDIVDGEELVILML